MGEFVLNCCENACEINRPLFTVEVFHDKFCSTMFHQNFAEFDIDC